VGSLPTLAIWSIAAAAVLSPVFAFLIAIAIEIVLGVLKNAGMLELVALAVIGAIGWVLPGKLWVGPRRRAPVKTCAHTSG
jgi:hypothetical protein